MKFIIETLSKKGNWRKNHIEAGSEEEAIKKAGLRMYTMSSYTGSSTGFVESRIKNGWIRVFDPNRKEVA